jgi:TPR repeat protein
VDQDQQEAVRWFIRAARQGNKTAQHNLGLHYAALELKEAVAAKTVKDIPR